MKSASFGLTDGWILVFVFRRTDGRTDDASMTREDEGRTATTLRRANSPRGTEDMRARVKKEQDDASEYELEMFGSFRELDETTREWCFELTKRNMRAMYETSWGWDAVEKRRELNNGAARFIVARQRATGTPAAFVHFRFEKEDEDVDAPVGYIYELQCEPEHQRKSLGRTLVACVERLSESEDMDAVVLTVLKVNEAARGFYANKMKYEVDDNSPEEEDCHYLILSKRFR